MVMVSFLVWSRRYQLHVGYWNCHLNTSGKVRLFFLVEFPSLTVYSDMMIKGNYRESSRVQTDVTLNSFMVRIIAL